MVVLSTSTFKMLLIDHMAKSFQHYGLYYFTYLYYAVITEFMF